MRTNIVIDDVLMAQAMKAAGVRTKRETVELALKTLVSLAEQGSIRHFRGKLDWRGNLDDMRHDG